MSLHVHPLALISICDHFTRCKQLNCKESQVVMRKDITSNCRNNENSPASLGLLFGEQSSEGISILDATDVVIHRSLNEEVLDFHLGDVHKKVSLLQQVYPRYQLLGWYLVIDHETDSEIIESLGTLRLHQQIASVNHNAQLLLLKPQVEKLLVDDLTPCISLYTLVESVLSLENMEIRINQTELFTIDAIFQQKTDARLAGDFLKTVDVSITILMTHIDRLLQILKHMIDGLIPIDHALLRTAGNFVARLKKSTVESAHFDVIVALEKMSLYLQEATQLTKETSHFIDNVAFINSDYHHKI